MTTNKRINPCNTLNFDTTTNTVTYWMSRDQRVQDNWALIYAQQFALKYNKNLTVVFCLQNNFLNAQNFILDYMQQGLKSVENQLTNLNIQFIVLKQTPEQALPQYIATNKVGALFTDFSPLKIKTNWKNEILQNIKIPYFEVDAHNVIPVWETSQKQEYAAKTIRPKILNNLNNYLIKFDALKVMPGPKVKNQNFTNILLTQSPHDIALKKAQDFIKNKLSNYEQFKNDPTQQATSQLSAHLHFGHICTQTILLLLKQNNIELLNNNFVEEILVRKELADNFCYYNNNYDNSLAFNNWAITTLNKHLKDKRDYLYTLEQFENAKTHDELWNAIQRQLVNTNYINGYLRMYWAKKILEWTEHYNEAQEFAIYLNDKYQLDGRDPNGYTGIAWSIGGIHDRPWFERPIFGTIRYMNQTGCKKRFDLKTYINTFTNKI